MFTYDATSTLLQSSARQSTQRILLRQVMFIHTHIHIKTTSSMILILTMDKSNGYSGCVCLVQLLQIICKYLLNIEPVSLYHILTILACIHLLLRLQILWLLLFYLQYPRNVAMREYFFVFNS